MLPWSRLGDAALRRISRLAPRRRNRRGVDSEARGPTTGAQMRGLPDTPGRQAQSEQARGGAAAAAASAQLTRRRGVLQQPASGVVGRLLSGAGGRLTAPLRGRHSRREDGRLDRLGRCCAASRRADRRAARMAAAGGCVRLNACSSLRRYALLERIKVEGALCSKASSKPVAFLQREQRETC